jgi:hypothetical protein
VRQWQGERVCDSEKGVCCMRNAVAVYESGQCVCVGDGGIREPSLSVCCRFYRSDVSEDAIHGETITPTASSSPS